MSTSTEDDAAYLGQLGYKQELKRNHSKLSLLGFCFIILNTWTAIASSLQLALPTGGPSVVIWGLAASGVCNMCLAASMAEFASAYPVASGQYHWTFMISPPRYARLLSLICGWMNVCGWVFLIGTATTLAVYLIMGLAVMFHPTYVMENWHLYLVYLGLSIVNFSINAFLNNLIPLIGKSALYFSITGLVVITVTVLSTASPNFQPASFVFGGVINETGWPTGFAWMLGLLQGTLCLVGYDAPAHMSEEIPSPSRTVPRIMITAVLIGTVSGLIISTILLFSIQSLSIVLTSPSGPFIALILQATSSTIATTLLVLFPLICMLTGLTSMTTTASRLIYAFARDGGLPASPWLSRINGSLGVPLNALLAIMGVITVFGLFFFAGADALNAMAAMSVVSTELSYALPVAVLMCRGRRGLPEGRPFVMAPAIAWTCNVVGVAFVILTTVLFMFPATNTSGSMNYTVVAFAAVVVIAVVDYLGWAKKRWKGPMTRLEIFEDARIKYDGEKEVMVG